MSYYRAQSSLSIYAEMYLRKCKYTYFILQNKYLCIYEDSFGVKILRDDCVHRKQKAGTHFQKIIFFFQSIIINQIPMYIYLH